MKQKNFKEIYDVIYANVGNLIEEKRKTALRKNLLTILIAIIIWAIIIMNSNSRYLPVFGFGIVITIMILIFVVYKINKDYKKTYKERVISEIVKQSNPSFKYFYDKGMSSKEYAESNFDFGWDRYNTEDLIEGTLEDGSTLRMAQVHTEEEHRSTDAQGHTTTTYVTTFLGLYGIIGLKTATRAEFVIKDNSKLAKFNKNRIEMESAEFEKYYDVYSGRSKDTEVRQNAMEILTPEAIEEFVKIRNMFKKSLNVRVSGDKIYFRIYVGDIFEPPTFKSSVNFDMLQKYFLIIDVPRMIYETLIDNILVMYGDQKAKENRNLAQMTDEQREEYDKQKEEELKKTYFSHD